jgi:gliding motility-associated-like protein
MKHWLLAAALSIFTTVIFTQNITSTFDTNDEGWRIVNYSSTTGITFGTALPTYTRTTVGTPNGFISKYEGLVIGGSTLYFSAPAKFLGNHSRAYGNNLSFDIKVERDVNNASVRPYGDDNLVIEGGGITLYTYLEPPPTNWTHVDCRLDESRGWLVNNRNTGRPATKADVQRVLCNITKIWIRCEYNLQADEGFLDNVVLETDLPCYNTTLISKTVCTSQLPYNFNGKLCNAAGIYSDTIKKTDPCSLLCDSIVRLNLRVVNALTRNIDTTICAGQSMRGKIYSESVFFKDTIKNIGGCDSIISVNLTVLPSIIKNPNITICQGDSLRFGTKRYFRTGTYVDTLKSIGGCDSIITTTLTVLSPIRASQNRTICQGESIKLGDYTYTQSGAYRDTIQYDLGCDSLITTTNLTVLTPSVFSQNLVICAGNSIKIGNNTYIQAGIFTDTLKNFRNCDSIVTTILKVNPISVKSQSFTICQGGSIKVGTKSYNSSGVFSDTLKNFTNCDSIITTTLTVNPLSVKTQNIAICPGESIRVGTKTYNRAGIFIDTLKNATNCDSIITTTLTIYPVALKSQKLTVCQGESIQVGTKTYNRTGIFTDTLKNFTNCDSIVTTTLTVLAPLSISQNLTVCQGNSIRVGTKTYKQAGVFIDTLKSFSGCDSIVTTRLTVSPPLSKTQVLSICEGSSIKVGTKNYTQSGIFKDTLQNASGCDSIVTTNLTVNKIYSRTQNIAICPTSSYSINNRVYTQAGTYNDTLRSQQGCDSVIITVLSIKNEAITNQNLEICEGGSIKVGTKTYNTTGVFRDTFRTFSGCDSIVVTNLTVNKPTSKTLTATICQGESFQVGTKNYMQSGTFTEVLKNSNNCDSIITTKLTVLSPVRSSQNLTICQGNSFKIGLNTYNKTGIFTDTLKNFNNCDSVVTTNLTVSPPLSKSQILSICEDNFIKVGNKTYNQTGVFKDTLQTASGCDSIVTTNLTVNKKYSRTQNVSICPTGSYNINFRTYKLAGTYYDTLFSKQGCDSVVITILSVTNAVTSTQNIAFCEGNSLKVGAKMYTATGNYIDTIRTMSSCDSIVYTNLTVNKRTFNTIKTTICQGEKLQVGLKTFTQTGNFTEILKNAGNCDSIVTINLTVIPPLSKTQILTVCEGDLVKIGTKTYDKTGIFTDTLKSFTGCDSVVTTNLTVNKKNAQTQNVAICPTGSFTVGPRTYTQAGTYRDSLKNRFGCDSIVSTILTIQTATRRTQTREICNGQTLKVGNRVYSQTGIYQDTFRFTTGCDSIVTTNLTVSEVFVSSQTLDICEGSSVKIGTKTYTQSGIFTDTLKSIAGCDSIVLTILKVNTQILKTVTRTICASESVKVGQKTYNKTGIYRDTLKTVFGCDSIITTNLTVENVLASSQNVTLCLGQSLKISQKTYTQAGIYRDTLKTLTGCDSIITTNLSFNSVIFKNQILSLCEGEKLKVGAKTYSQTGVYKDTLKSFGGCDSIITTNLTISQIPTRSIDTTICGNKTLIINGKTYSQSGVFQEFIKVTGKCDSLLNISINVKPLAFKRNEITLCPSDTLKNLRIGTFRDTIATAVGCPEIIESVVQVSRLRVSAGADISIELGDSVRLALTIPTGGNVLWKWQTNKALSCTDCANPVAKPLETTVFSVEAKDTASNCSVKDDVRVIVKACSSIFLPTSFSPNGDGQNDYFTVFASGCVKSVKKMMVFNRWGALVFSKENFIPNNDQEGWDGTFQGKTLVADVYTYLFELEVNNGKIEKVWGDVTLMK